MKKELLVPVGEMASLISAIHNGCDAVYLGGKSFGARKFAKNFDRDEMILAIKKCHLYGVKIYVTINTLIYESEIEEFVDYVKFLYLNKVDAVIMQDIGMIKLVHELFPNLVIHASTQMHNHNIDGIKELEKLGVKRVVLARELSLEEINNLDTPLEIEAFIHGALCICYSGQCLFSSLMLNRSGNRGECAGICRLPFKLTCNEGLVNTSGEYLLSPKEVCTISRFKELMDSKILSFKIEGRMKSPLYVGYITRLYRKLMDGLEVTKEEMDNLLSIYNREFTLGHLFNQSNDDLMNIASPNHIGLYIGDVIKYDREYITIKLHHDIYQNDGIRFKNSNLGMMINYLYNDKELLINQGLKNQVIKVPNKLGIKELDQVYLTTNNHLSDLVLNGPKKLIDIKVNVEAYLNEPLKITINDGTNEVSLSGVIVSLAKSSPLDKDRIIEQVSKVGDYPFRVVDVDIKMDDNIFIVISEINKLRRDVLENLKTLRENSGYESVINEYQSDVCCYQDTGIAVLVRNNEQLETCLEHNVDYIYVDDYELYLPYQELPNVYYRSPRVCNKTYDIKRALVGELGSINKYQNSIGDYYLNCSNTESIKYYLNNGLRRITISPEVSDFQLTNMDFKDLNVEKIVYGHLEVMVMKHDLVNYLTKYDINNEYHLKDRENKLYPVEKDIDNITHIFNTDTLDLIPNINSYRRMGIGVFRVELLNESKEELEKVLTRLCK